MLEKVLEALAEKSPELAIMGVGAVLVASIAAVAIREVRRSYDNSLKRCQEMLKELSEFIKKKC